MLLFHIDDASVYALSKIDSHCGQFGIIATKPLGDVWDHGHRICIDIKG